MPGIELKTTVKVHLGGVEAHLAACPVCNGKGTFYSPRSRHSGSFVPCTLCKEQGTLAVIAYADLAALVDVKTGKEPEKGKDISDGIQT